MVGRPDGQGRHAKAREVAMIARIIEISAKFRGFVVIAYAALIVLAIVPAGRMWGIDARLWRDNPALRRWPF